jgi:RNA polymerase sigma-70 factor (ECF subfamily)
LNFSERLSSQADEDWWRTFMPRFPETNHSLVARVKDLGDGASWIEFMGIYQPVVYRMAKRRGLQDADANDVMQQVFVSVAGAIDRWEPGEGLPPFRAWLTTITKNAISKALSRRPRDRAAGSTSVMEQLNAVADGDVSTDEEFIAQSRQQMFRWAAQRVRVDFAQATWDMFWRTSVLGESVSEVAAATGRTTGAIYIARHRVVARLKEEIADLSNQWEL